MVGVHKQCNIVTHPPQHSMPSMCRHPPTQPSSIELHRGPAYPIHHPCLPHPNERNLSPKDPQSTWRSKLPLRCLLSTSDHKIIFETSSWWIQYNSSLSLSVLRYVTLLLLGHACWYVRPNDEHWAQDVAPRQRILTLLHCHSLFCKGECFSAVGKLG